VLPERASVGKGELLNFGPTRVRGPDDAKDSYAVPPAGGKVRIHGVPTEVGIHRHGVREWQLGFAPGLEVRGGVGTGGRADVPALRVEDHEQAR
jgi:hypothetical protein